MTKRATIIRVIDKLETRGEIAHRIGAQPATVDRWIIRGAEYRSNDPSDAKAFPEPVGELGGSAIYWRDDIDRWLEATGRTEYRAQAV